MRAALRRAVAASMGAPVTLLTALPELFAGVQDLGAERAAAVRMLVRAGAAPDWRFLDLGCGKGGVAVAVARRIIAARHGKGSVRGVDAFRPFIDAARRLAAGNGVEGACVFEIDDVGSFERGPLTRRYDAAVMLNLYGCERASRVLRRWVRPGGVYLVDDAVWIGQGAGGAPTREDCRGLIERKEDRIEQEWMPSPAHLARSAKARIGAVERAGATLCKAQPRLKRTVDAYVRTLERSAEALSTGLRPCLWLVRRGRA